MTLKEAVESAERATIAAAVQRHRGYYSRAAAELGISRHGLYKKLKKYGLFIPVAFRANDPDEEASHGRPNSGNTQS